MSGSNFSPDPYKNDPVAADFKIGTQYPDRFSHSSRYGGRYSNSRVDSSTHGSAAIGTASWIDSMWKQYGLPDSMKDEFYNNPHLAEYLEFAGSSGIFGGMSEVLTGSSSQSRNRAKALAAIYDYWNNMKSEARQNEYNSESAKAERMREAGLNPSLLGTGDVSDDVGNPEAQFDIPFESGMSDVQSSFSPIMDVVKTYMSLRTGFAQLKGIEIANQARSVDKFSSISDFAADVAINSITSQSFEKYKSDGSTFLDAATLRDSRLATNYGFTDPREIQAFNTAYNRTLRSVFTENETYDAFVKNQANQLKRDLLDQDMEYGVSSSLMDYAKTKCDIDIKYAQMELDLLDNPDWNKLWSDERFASIRAQIQSANAESAEGAYNEEFWKQMSDNNVQNEQVNAMRSQYAQMIRENLAHKAEVEYRIANATYEKAVAEDMKLFLTGSGKERRTLKPHERRMIRRLSRTRYGRSGFYDAGDFGLGVWNAANGTANAVSNFYD